MSDELQGVLTRVLKLTTQMYEAAAGYDWDACEAVQRKREKLILKHKDLLPARGEPELVAKIRQLEQETLSILEQRNTLLKDSVKSQHRAKKAQKAYNPKKFGP